MKSLVFIALLLLNKYLLFELSTRLLFHIYNYILSSGAQH